MKQRYGSSRLEKLGGRGNGFRKIKVSPGKEENGLGLGSKNTYKGTEI